MPRQKKPETPQPEPTVKPKRKKPNRGVNNGAMGRPTVYNSTFHPKLIRLMAEKGYIDKQIADALGIAAKTLQNWYDKYPEARTAKREGMEAPNGLVENALLKKALGFREPAVKIFMPAGAREPVYAPYEEYYAPDTAAAFIWLKNRVPERWSDYPKGNPNTPGITFNIKGGAELLALEGNDNVEGIDPK